MYRLEYSPKQKGFHVDDGSNQPDKNGWHTISDNLPEEVCNEFINAMHKKFPALDFLNVYRDTMKTLSVETIKEEFLTFTKTIKL